MRLIRFLSYLKHLASRLVEVDKNEEMVRPNPNRCAVILREIPGEVKQEVICNMSVLLASFKCFSALLFQKAKYPLEAIDFVSVTQR